MNEKRKEVIERLLNEIQNGDIVSKGKLPTERKLVELLGEGRPIIREALISLEAMGVIEIRERQGIYLSSSEENEAKMLLNKVHDWPVDALSRVMEMRQLLDPAAAALAAVRRSNSDISKMQDCLREMRAVVHDSSDEANEAGIYWNTVYHTVIVSASGNSYLARIYESLLAMVEHGTVMMRRGTSPTEQGGRQVAYRDHENLFTAIKEKNANEAERVAEDHLAHTVRAMVQLGQIVPSSNLYAQKLAGRLRFE